MCQRSGKVSRVLRLFLIAAVALVGWSVVMPAANPPGGPAEPIEPGETFTASHRVGKTIGTQLPFPCGDLRLEEHGNVSDFAGPSGGAYVITQGTSDFSSPFRF